MKKNKIFFVIVPILLVAIMSLAIILPLSVKKTPDEVGKAFVDLTWSKIANVAEKGGAIYLESGANYVMKGGEISGKGNTYGGAVYVSSGSSFTMEGGTIRNCRARYGGAIYVESGGRCVINGGTIVDNEATVAPAIYLEEGARLTVGNIGTITNNKISEDYLFIKLYPETRVGESSSSISYPMIYYGHYPRSYVGNKMNQTLEDWYQENMPESSITYNLGDQVWNAYEYEDDVFYVRGNSKIYNATTSNVRYLNGEVLIETGEVCWFKMEPVRWFILNYSNWSRGLEYMRLLSELIVAGNVRFNAEGEGSLWINSELRTWLNDEFLDTAFTGVERAKILTTEVLNNVSGDYTSSTSDGKGETTYDQIFVPSYYELVYTYLPGSYCRYCSPSDFAITNYVNVAYTDSTYSYGRNESRYFSRSSYDSENIVRFLQDTAASKITDLDTGIRPMMRIDLKIGAAV